MCVQVCVCVSEIDFWCLLQILFISFTEYEVHQFDSADY